MARAPRTLFSANPCGCSNGVVLYESSTKSAARAEVNAIPTSGRRRQVLPEFIAVRVPTRDRLGKSLPPERRDKWVQLLKEFLLDDVGASGLEEDRIQGLWRGEYDPEAGALSLVSEECLLVRCYLSREQFDGFVARGEELLIRMARALKQDAIAYETRTGLIILYAKEE